MSCRLTIIKHMYYYFPCRAFCQYTFCFHNSFPTLLVLPKKRLQSADGGPSCKMLHHPVASSGITGLSQSDGMERGTPSKAWLSSNPVVSNRNVKKTKLSLFRGRSASYQSRQVGVISPADTVTRRALGESYLLGPR